LHERPRVEGEAHYEVGLLKRTLETTHSRPFLGRLHMAAGAGMVAQYCAGPKPDEFESAPPAVVSDLTRWHEHLRRMRLAEWLRPLAGSDRSVARGQSSRR
jgi:hypothetical protein